MTPALRERNAYWIASHGLYRAHRARERFFRLLDRLAPGLGSLARLFRLY